MVEQYICRIYCILMFEYNKKYIGNQKIWERNDKEMLDLNKVLYKISSITKNCMEQMCIEQMYVYLPGTYICIYTQVLWMLYIKKNMCCFGLFNTHLFHAIFCNTRDPIQYFLPVYICYNFFHSSLGFLYIITFKH